MQKFKTIDVQFVAESCRNPFPSIQCHHSILLPNPDSPFSVASDKHTLIFEVLSCFISFCLKFLLRNSNIYSSIQRKNVVSQHYSCYIFKMYSEVFSTFICYVQEFLICSYKDFSVLLHRLYDTLLPKGIKIRPWMCLPHRPMLPSSIPICNYICLSSAFGQACFGMGRLCALVCNTTVLVHVIGSPRFSVRATKAEIHYEHFAFQ